jgi:hypothetical protein
LVSLHLSLFPSSIAFCVPLFIIFEASLVFLVSSWLEGSKVQLLVVFKVTCAYVFQNWRLQVLCESSHFWNLKIAISSTVKEIFLRVHRKWPSVYWWYHRHGIACICIAIGTASISIILVFECMRLPVYYQSVLLSMYFSSLLILNGWTDRRYF